MCANTKSIECNEIMKNKEFFDVWNKQKKINKFQIKIDKFSQQKNYLSIYLIHFYDYNNDD